MSTEAVILGLIIAVVGGVVGAEVGPWCGWLAERLLPVAAKLRYDQGDRADTRAEQWLNDLRQIPGQLGKLVYSLGHLMAGTAACMRRKIEHTIPDDLASEGIVRGLLDLIPLAIMRRAARQLPSNKRRDFEDEWRSELAYILRDTEPLPLTGFIQSTTFATGLLISSRHLARELTGRR